jgi:ribosome maturation factor RimP
VTAVHEELISALTPLLTNEGLELFDLEVRSATIVVTVDRPGGIDLDALAAANRIVSGVLDQIDPMPGRYTLEVTSPGLERRLRTPEHFAKAVGSQVAVRTTAGTEPRRVQGELRVASGTEILIDAIEPALGEVRLALDQIDRARTVFEWGAAPAVSPSKGPKRAKSQPTTERATTP